MKKILILSANPINTYKLRLDQEVREIQTALERSRNREQVELIFRGATRIDDLRRTLLDNNPQIVHFSGHGAGADGIAMENNFGYVQLISTQSLRNLFELFKNKVECVLLNACYSEAQADAIYQHIDCVIGMRFTISDNAAINFSIGFYDAIGTGRSYADAFKFGCNNIDMNNIPEFSTPIIKSHHISKRLFDNNQINTEFMEPKSSQSLTITGSTVAGQIGQAGRDVIQNQQNTQEKVEKQLSSIEVVDIIAKLEAIFRASNLPDEQKKQALKHLDYAKDAIQEKESDKKTAIASIQKATKVLKEANEALGAGQGIWKKLETIAQQLAPCLGITVENLLLLS